MKLMFQMKPHQDIIVNVSVPVKDIYENIEKVISLEIKVPCPDCDFPKRCAACFGKKSVSKENFVFDAAETQVIFEECSNYEYTKKRGDVIINVFPKEGQFKILNRIHLMCECAVFERSFSLMEPLIHLILLESTRFPIRASKPAET